jgi:hypothetical protein
MTLLETIKQELDTLPEDMLSGILADINRKKRFASIPGMMDIIQQDSDTPLSECIPKEDTER